MKTRELADQPPHLVLNQATPWEDINLYSSNTTLREAVRRDGAAWAEGELDAHGQRMGRAEVLALGAQANENEPVLKTHDRFGNRVDQVTYHPSYHELMRLGCEHGGHGDVWAEPKEGAHVARCAHMYLHHQVEQGTACPLTMTFAVVPSLRLQPSLAEVWEPRAVTKRYDPRFLPADQKEGVLFGMAMTERQGGSDVRSNTTRARAVNGGGPGGEYRLEGHKWFCSAPMCDAFLVLAQAPAGLSCFLVPRFTPDGQVNAGFRVNRLKPKVGNRSNASSEIEFQQAFGQLVGEEGRGVATIIEMVRHTRLDTTVGASALIRRCLAEAHHHTRHRWAFNRRLVDQPLMRNVLADLAIESEAAVAFAFRIARAFDAASADRSEMGFARVGTAVGKYWLTKRETVVAREAMECFGGNGFIEEGPMGRLFRESPLNSIWEGAGNVQCLDVLRAMKREPEAFETVIDEIRAVAGESRGLDALLERVLSSLAEPEHLEVRARRLVEDLAVGVQASILLRWAPTPVAETFVRSRVDGDYGRMLGTLPADSPFDAIIDRIEGV